VALPRPKLLARLALLAFAALCALWLAHLDYREKISTNVLDLIPATEQSPEVAFLRRFANDIQARVVLFALESPAADTPPADAAQQFAAALARSPAFAEAVVIGDTSAQQKLGRALFDRRFELLLPGWLGDRRREFDRTGRPAREFPAWLADHAAADLEAFLARPEATAMQDLVLSDPLLLIPPLLEQARLVAPAETATGRHALVWARMRASPLSDEGQQPVFVAIDAAFAQVHARFPAVTLRWTGVNRFAAASRARIEREMRLLNFASIAGVLAVAALFVRRVHRIVHLLPVILCSLAGAWTLATLAFDRLHILVFVIGSLLSGVAIDYGVYIFLQPPRHEGEPYAEKLRHLLKPLLASCLTTVLGFSLLLFSDLPLIRQIGLFVSAGLLCALGSAILYFAQIRHPFLASRTFRLPRLFPAPAPSRQKNQCHLIDDTSAEPPIPADRRPSPDTRLRRPLRALLVLAALIALLGPWRLQWRDDVHQLDLPAPELHANDTAVRALFGDDRDRSVYLTYGDTFAAARQNLAAFLDHLHRTAPNPSASSLGLLLPTESDWRALPDRLRELAGFATDFRSALERHGFSPDSFSSFFLAWQKLRADPPRGPYAALAATLDPLLTGPMSLLSSHGDASPAWLLTIVDSPARLALPPALHTISVDQLQSLNHLFTRYRWSALRLSLVGLALVIGSVFVIYPFRRGLRIALIPAGSCFFVFGLFGLLGLTLNLFNLLGAFLGVCLSHNYSIFSSDAAATGTAPPAAIRLSALCTATSFGVLAFSHIPVIHALGLTVALIVLTALTTVELESLARRPPD
jgi:predicted exporter